MTIKETMMFRIFILFLSVAIIQSEFRTELWRTQESEYENRNNFSKYSKDYRPEDSNGRSQIYFPSNNPFEKPQIGGNSSAHERQENDFGVFTHKREESNIGDSIYTREENNIGDSTYKREENNFGDSISKREENKVQETLQREENISGNSPSPGGLTPEGKCGLDVPRRIIGGATTDIDEFPWLCLLEYADPSGKVSYDCSGVLISKRYVLTAAHCTDGPGLKARELKVRRVRLGEWDISSDKDCQGDVCSSQLQEIDVENVIPHESYKPRDKSQVNDIALIRLSREANLNQFVQPICLPSAKIGGMDFEDKKLTVAGWGRTSNARDSSSNVKMKVDLPVVSRERCRQFYQSFYDNLRISESQFCAGGEEGKDTCQGDSGGPLMTIERTNNEIKWYVIGIVSSGPAACGVQDRPSLYTNVSQYTNWIMDNIKN